MIRDNRQRYIERAQELMKHYKLESSVYLHGFWDTTYTAKIDPNDSFRSPAITAPDAFEEIYSMTAPQSFIYPPPDNSLIAKYFYCARNMIDSIGGGAYITDKLYVPRVVWYLSIHN